MGNKLNLDNSSYFKSLPEMVQETIKQCSVEITSEAQLKSIAENIMKKNG